MSLYPVLRAAAFGVFILSLPSCGSGVGKALGFGDPETNRQVGADSDAAEREMRLQQGGLPTAAERKKDGTIWDLFGNADDPNTTVEVNKYIWNATLDILNFLPVQTVDPFTGVIVTGYGVPPGGGRAYRATVYIQDPALDARSLKLSLQTRGGGSVSRDTQRAVEDAILTRARQLRIRDSKL